MALIIRAFLAIVLAALAYLLCVALGLPAIVGIIAAVLILLATFAGDPVGRL